MMALRGAGDSLTPLWFMGLSVVLDAGLNPLLIAGYGPFPQMGIAGSATATVIATYVSLIAMTAYVYGRDLPMRLRGVELRYVVPTAALLRVILSKGLPMAIQMMVVSGSAIAMIALVNQRGLLAAAAFGVASQLWTYIQMPAMAIGAGVSTMAAQNIGAGKWDRIWSVTQAGLVINFVLTGALVAAVAFADRAALTLFLPEGSEALPIARHINAVASWSFVLFGATMVLFGTVRANGAVVAPLMILAFAMFPVRIGGAIVLEPWLGEDALWWSLPLGSTASLILASLYYKWGNWRAARPLLPEAMPGRPGEVMHAPV